MKIGRWRGYALNVIRDVLAELPADVDLKTAQKAISEAYPFGERSNHPYSAWLKAVQETLSARFPEYRQQLAKKRLLARQSSSGLSPLPESLCRSLFGDEASQ